MKNVRKEIKIMPTQKKIFVICLDYFVTKFRIANIILDLPEVVRLKLNKFEWSSAMLRDDCFLILPDASSFVKNVSGEEAHRCRAHPLFAWIHPSYKTFSVRT